MKMQGCLCLPCTEIHQLYAIWGRWTISGECSWAGGSEEVIASALSACDLFAEVLSWRNSHMFTSQVTIPILASKQSFHHIIANSESETHGSAETVACGNSSPVLTMLPLFIDDFANITTKNCSIWPCTEWTVWTQPPAMAIKPHRHLLIVTHLSHLSAWLIGLVLRASVCVCVVLLDDCCALWPFSQFLFLRYGYSTAD